jgi:hypothetical protein
MQWRSVSASRVSLKITCLPGLPQVTTVQKTAVYGTLTDMSPSRSTGMLARHQGRHSGRPLQQLTASRPNSASA